MNIPHGVLIGILDELAKAEIKHPYWPDDRLRQLAIVQEELGEVTKAVLNEIETRESTALSVVNHIDEIEKELAQTAAMSIRMMCSLRGQDVKEARDQEACIDPRLGRSR